MSVPCSSRPTAQVRRDRAQRLTLGEALASGGGGALLLEHLLPELAYKLGRAPKYGA